MTLLTRIVKYGQAFFIALGYTLRGEKPAALAAKEERQAAAVPLLTWCMAGVRLADEAVAAADRAGLDEAARKAFVLRLEGRDLSLATAIATVRFHVSQEFPNLLRSDESYARLAIQATTVNDQFMITRFAESDNCPDGLKTALQVVLRHLEAPPLS